MHSLDDNFGVRRLHSRWVLQADAETKSAIHLGGEEDSLADAGILRDPLTRLPLLSGATLAGALRASLARRRPGGAERLFGSGTDEGAPSALCTFDAVADGGVESEVRDGVALAPATGLAAPNAKYDFEVLPAGVRFPLRLELEVTAAETEVELLDLVVEALAELAGGQLRMGLRRTRGLGRLGARNWRSRRYDLTSAEGWADYLRSDPADPIARTGPAHPGPARALGRPEPARLDRGAVLSLELECIGGLLVRQAEVGSEADVRQFQSGGGPLLPGSSLAGALRARARMIASLVRPRDSGAWVDYVFGPGPGSPRREASRLLVTEAAITGGKEIAASRTRIDRFSGGAADTALFTEAPWHAGRLTAQLALLPRGADRPEVGDAALGLLLLVVKDLLDGDLPLGGSSSVGRGFVRGGARLEHGGRAVELRPRDLPDPWVGELIRAFHQAPELEAANDR